MPTRLCLTPKCANPATHRGRCPRHTKQRNTETRSLNKPVYNSARWKHTRQRVLFEQPLCPCGHIATDVDHILDIQQGGDPWARTNLQALCHSCHATKTRSQATR